MTDGLAKLAVRLVRGLRDALALHAAGHEQADDEEDPDPEFNRAELIRYFTLTGADEVFVRAWLGVAVRTR